MLDYLTIGTIVNVHGVHGEVKVMPETDDVNRFRKLKKVLLSSGGTRREIEIKGVKFSNKFVILKFEGKILLNPTFFSRNLFDKRFLELIVLY